MSPAERLALIRARVRPAPVRLSVKPKGQFCAAHPETSPATRRRMKRDAKEAKCKFRSDLFSLALSPPARRNVWVKEPDPIRPHHLSHSRRWVKNPLNRIAEQLPMKLPVLEK